MTVYPFAAGRLLAAGLLVLYRHRYEALLRDGVEHAHRLVEAIDEPWLYREVTA